MDVGDHRVEEGDDRGDGAALWVAQRGGPAARARKPVRGGRDGQAVASGEVEDHPRDPCRVAELGAAERPVEVGR